MTETARASITTRWRARRLSESARAALLRAPVADDELGILQTSVVGLDPLRVLVFGSGPLIGYGVTTRREAADGVLAELLAECTGRGAVVENRVRLALPTRDAVRSLGWAGTVTFGAAVWAPRFGEELQHRNAGQCRSEIRTMLREFREQSEIPLVVCHLPTPLGFDWRTLLRRPRVAHLNRVLNEEAKRVPNVVAVDIGKYRPSEAATTVGPAWQRGVAERLLPAVLQALGARDRSLVGSRSA